MCDHAAMTDRKPTGKQQASDRDTDRDGLSVAEAADRLGLTPDAVRARLHRGTLGGEKYAGAWRVWLSDDGTPTGTDRQTTGDRQDPTGHRQDAPTGETVALRAHVEDLRRDLTYLRDQLDQRSRELAAERERADILHREALSRIPALGAGDAATPDDRAAASTPAPVAPWWRCLWGGR